MPTTFAEFDTRETADCVEACPIEGFEASVVAATYQLQKPTAEEAAADAASSDRRTGTLQHFRFAHDGEDAVRVDKIAEMETSSGIFDIKWSGHVVHGRALLAAATAAGTVELFSLDTSLAPTELASEGNAESMCLSLDWSNRVHADASPSICVSHSDGALSTWNVSSGGLTMVSKWDAHNLFGAPIEAWIVAFNCHDTNTLFSGADDATLKGWDLRAPSKPLFQRSQHSMGVCSIQMHPHDDTLLAVGSYDEHVSLWDVRQMKTPLSMHCTGGGVWRLKWHPLASRQVETVTAQDLLLAACMHNGFQVLQTQADQTLTRATSYERHQSLAYGVDWWRDRRALEAAEPVVASCSFYDHVFHVWR
ncbi:hypothetical protein P43SY_003394 [Pythium insidiosum]|uniref:methylated diphthine methylhydrolase n=1 Tax=Pythium insidiosum TaxID=114742 RepID=A0AAD5Q540_PYTIN|nr:hypothetical protein P43SY_003394 [Pythium insidiosum]